MVIVALSDTASIITLALPKPDNNNMVYTLVNVRILK